MGYLTTVRGKGGGLRLARAAKSIVIGDVARRTEPDLALVPCFEPINAGCAITPACKLRKTLFEARDAFLKVLDSYTLADLTVNASALSAILAANGPAMGCGCCNRSSGVTRNEWSPGLAAQISSADRSIRRSRAESPRPRSTC